MAKTSEEIERTREERSRIKKIEISIGKISKDVGSLYEESKKFSENINNVTYVIGNIDTLDQKLKTLNNFIEENIISNFEKINFWIHSMDVSMKEMKENNEILSIETEDLSKEFKIW